jgi:hypothetical protein
MFILIVNSYKITSGHIFSNYAFSDSAVVKKLPLRNYRPAIPAVGQAGFVKHQNLILRHSAEAHSAIHITDMVSPVLA